MADSRWPYPVYPLNLKCIYKYKLSIIKKN